MRMPRIRIKNISPNTITFGSSIGTLSSGEVETKDISAAQFEDLSDALLRLQRSNLIQWSLEQSTEPDENLTEFFPVGASATKTQAQLELWVDAANGNDTNDGRSFSSALATLVEAESRIPDIVTHDVIIRVGPHTGLGYDAPTFRPRVLRKNIYVIANPDTFTELYSDTARATSNHTQIVAPAGLGSETYRGAILEMTSGGLAGFRRTIGRNTDTAFFPSACFLAYAAAYPILAVGDSYRVIRPTVRIIATDTDTSGSRWNISAGAPSIITGGPFDSTLRRGSVIAFDGFVLAGPAGVTLTLSTSEIVILSSCEFSGDEASAILSVGTFRIGIEYVATDSSGTNQTWERLTTGIHGGATEHAWIGSGLTATGTIYTGAEASILGYGVVAAKLYQFGGYANVRAANFHTSGITVTGVATNANAVLILDGKMYLPDLNILINSSGAGIAISGRAYVAINDVAITSVGVGIDVSRLGHAYLAAATSITSTGVGIKTKTGGRVDISGATLVITTSANALEVGNTPTVATLATVLASSGAYVSEADGSIIQRVA